MSWKQKLGILFTCLIAALALSQPGPASAMEPIKVGILLPLSGSSATIGANSLKGHKLAVEEISTAGGIKSLGGRELELVVADSGGDPKQGMTQAERLITKDGVVAIMGAYNSAVTYPSTQVAERYKTLYIVPSSYKPDITKRGFKYTFRLCLTSELAAYKQISFIDRMGRLTGESVRTLGLLYENSDWGISTAEYWQDAAKEYGLEIVLNEPYPSNSATLDPVVKKIKHADPDALLFVSYVSDAILLAKGIQQQKIDAKVFMGTGGGHADPKFIENVGDASNYYFDLVETSPDIDLPIARRTNDTYRQKHDVDMSDDCIKCYTATYLLAKALEIAGSDDSQDLLRVMTNIKMIPGQEGIITPYGIEFDENGQNMHARALMVQTLDGKRKVVYPAELALPGSEIVWPAPAWDKR